mmetsp:Transcript_52303/g.86680  ORF Transcript_52303/g.86680 Transcript_52303/m.86680 type:complete len:319 (+) Transcript_52303:44-1000(+)
MACTSCGKSLPIIKIGGDHPALNQYLFELERGKWRQDFNFVCDLSFCECDIRIQRVDVQKWSAAHLTTKQLSRRFGSARWKSVSWEFLPLRNSDGQQLDIYDMYCKYMCARQGPNAALPFEDWLQAKCSSVIGSISPWVAEALSSFVIGDGLKVEKDSLVGSGFGVLRCEGQMVAVITLDFFGGQHQELGMAAKVFWLDVESKFGKSVVDLILYKIMALAEMLDYSKVLLGGSDPNNERHIYKFLRLRHGSEFLCEQGWIPIQDCVSFSDDRCEWSSQFSRVGRSPQSAFKGDVCNSVQNLLHGRMVSDSALCISSDS